MSESEMHFANPPIVEAIIDIDCDMPPNFNLAGLETIAQEAFHVQYPKSRRQYRQQHQIQRRAEETEVQSAEPVLHALQYWQNDNTQLVQVRTKGFSFNRLKPYAGLDAYLPEIKRIWDLYVELVKPVQIRAIRLRFINRIEIPRSGEMILLEEYFKVCPKLPDEDKLVLTGFFNQHTAVEEETGHQATIILASQPWEDNIAPVIFDIGVEHIESREPGDWSNILEVIQALRRLKNHIFGETLEGKCTDLFQ